MSLQPFFDNFAALADARNGVARLRELILQLAVEGKLVDQHSNDEPASALVKRIAVKKARLVKEKAIAPSKPLLPVTASEMAFYIPSNWNWEKLGNVAIVIQIGPFGSLLHKSDYVRNGTPLVNPSHIKNERIVISNDLTIDEKTKARLSNYIMQTGDIVMGRRGEMGKCAIVSEKETGWLCGTGSLFIRVTHDLFRPYLLKVLTSDYVEGCLVKDSVGSTMNNLNQRILKNLLIPIPPLEEQKRIVAKIDELMRLCDELEARQQVRRASRVRLSNAALGPLNKAASLAPEEFEQASMRLADNFITLYDSAETVGKLRSTILQLAVQGKLVPQDTNDEPASVLLEEIKRVKANSTNGKKIKKREPPPGVEDPEAPFVLPDGWQWRRFFDVATIASNLVQPRDYLDLPHVAPDNIEKFTGRLLPYRTVREDKVASSNHRFFTGQIVYSKIRPNLAKAVVVDFEGLCSADMYPISPHINSQFLLRYMLSETFLKMAVKSDTRVAMPKINQEELNKILVPVPPYKEQKRIVAKVNQLMALCDELETKLRQAEAHSEKVMDAAVQHVLASINATSTGTLAGASA